MSETTTVPRPTERFRGTDLGDEFVFYDSANDRVHVLNSTAREIYLLCDGSRDERAISESFAGQFSDSTEEARRDALVVLRQLAELGLVESTD